MATVRNIREFTVAVSRHLNECNWPFTSCYTKGRGMVFTLLAKLQCRTIEINLIPDANTPNFICNFAADNRIFHTLVCDMETDINAFLFDVILFLEKIRDFDIDFDF